MPEFLRERCAEIDFIENHDLCVIGTSDLNTFNLVKKPMVTYNEIVMVSSVEAELIKYFNNVYNSTLITLQIHL